MLQIGGTFVGPVGWLTRTPTWAFTDTENATLSNLMTFPLVDTVFTPACYELEHGLKHKRYPGFHELAYLHPNRFKPDPSVLSAFGLKTSDRYFIVRFVGWQSAHDIGERGLSASKKIHLVSELARHGHVFVSSEAPVPEALSSHASTIPIHKVHHFIAYATMVVGESATMASEAAVLGTPAIFVSPTGRGYTDTQERTYGLVFNFRDTDYDKAFATAEGLVTRQYSQDHWYRRRKRLLRDTIDVTEWLVKLVECFGETGDADAAARLALEGVREGKRLGYMG
jgi:predicted glycosyltransferase